MAACCPSAPAVDSGFSVVPAITEIERLDYYREVNTHMKMDLQCTGRDDGYKLDGYKVDSYYCPVFPRFPRIAMLISGTNTQI
jgi:hypothetical protein